MNRIKYFFTIIGLLIFANFLNLIPYNEPWQLILISFVKSLGFFIAFYYRMEDAGIKKYIKTTGLIALILSSFIGFFIWFFIIGGLIYKSNKNNNI